MRAWHFWDKGWLEDEEILVSCVVPRARDELYLVCRRASYLLGNGIVNGISMHFKLSGEVVWSGSQGFMPCKRTMPIACPCGNGQVLVRSCTSTAGRAVVGTPLSRLLWTPRLLCLRVAFKACGLEVGDHQASAQRFECDLGLISSRCHGAAMPDMLPKTAWQQVALLPRPEYPVEITILCPTAHQLVAGKYMLDSERWANGQRLWVRSGEEEMWLYSGHSGRLGEKS